MPFFWYWGFRKYIFVQKVLKLTIFGIGGLENAFLYMKVLKLPIFGIGSIEKAIFWYMVGVTKIRKMSYPSPHLNSKVRFVCNVTLSYFTLVQL